MKLDIIVPHYKEPWDVGRKLFDSIAMQECIDFNDISVIVVNDGLNCHVNIPFHAWYPYIIRELNIQHGGVSRARNAGLSESDADVVMFCDFDDCFQDIFALNKIFTVMRDDKIDVCVGTFTEETIDQNGNIVFVLHDADFMFIHGKAYRRKFLEEEQIRFCEKLTIHEDIYFSILVQMICTPSRVAMIKSPIYCWRWNPDSVTRIGKGGFNMRTYDHLIRQRFALTEELLRRNNNEGAMVVVVKTFVDAFYDSQKQSFRLPENEQYMALMERWFAAFYREYEYIYNKASLPVIAGMVKSCRELALKDRDFLIEHMTLEQWLKHIRAAADPVPAEEIDVLEDVYGD